LLRFSDSLLIELFRGTDAIVSEVRLDSGGFIFVRLKQVFGHSRIRLESIAKARVTVETDYATLTALVNDTEFVVCHGEALTCVVAISGEVEVEAQGQVVNIKGGEATYILKGQRPKPAICANMGEVTQFLDKKRGPEEIDPLGNLVQDLPQEPCHDRVSQLPPSPEPVAPTPPLVPPQSSCLVLKQTLDLYGKPGFDQPSLTTLYTGMQLDPLARNLDGSWIQVRVRESGQVGWVVNKPDDISCNIPVADLPTSQ
jgi:hypothetical protein